MEPAKAPLRTILPLGKARIIDRGPTYFKLALGGSTTMTVDFPIGVMERYDLRDGDLLTLYTEVLIKDATTQ